MAELADASASSVTPPHPLVSPPHYACARPTAFPLLPRLPFPARPHKHHPPTRSDHFALTLHTLISRPARPTPTPRGAALQCVSPDDPSPRPTRPATPHPPSSFAFAPLPSHTASLAPPKPVIITARDARDFSALASRPGFDTKTRASAPARVLRQPIPPGAAPTQRTLATPISFWHPTACAGCHLAHANVVFEG